MSTKKPLSPPVDILKLEKAIREAVISIPRKRSTVPTREEIDTAIKVLKHYRKKVEEILDVYEEEETAYEMARGVDVWTDILGNDPDKYLNDYLEEVKASR